MKTSENFQRYEFACHCAGDCGRDTVDAELVDILEFVRSHFEDKPIRIHSGHRCPEHNAAVGGSENSLHLVGRAADFSIAGVDLGDVFDWMDKQLPCTGLAIYDTFIHLDTRGYHCRWTG